LHTPIEPLIVYLQGEESQPGSQLIVRTQLGQTRAAIRAIQAKAKQVDLSVPFRFWFAEEEYRKNYRSEQIVGAHLACFAGLSLLLTCLGLLGLVIFMAEQRRKEISIRKVLGATVASIVVLFCREFSKLVLMA
jgi:hypothetical protein